MARVSIGAAWTETSAFVKREGALLLPVALLFVAIPFALMLQLIPDDFRAEMAKPRDARAMPELPVGVLLGLMLGFAITMIGTLSLYALALRPGISVAEALQRGLRRVPVSIGASLMVGFLLSVPMLMISVASPSMGTSFLLVSAAVVSIRLLPLNAIIVAQDRRIADSLKAGWAMTRGQFWKLAGFALLLMALTVFAEVVAQMMLGLVGYVIAGAEGGAAGANLGTALAMGVAQIYSSVMISRLYLQFTR